LREEVALDQLQAHNAAIAKGVRLTGSADEAEAFDYIAAQCEAFGLNVRRYAVDALVSLPGAASLAVTGPEARDFPCITHSASRPTGPGGITHRSSTRATDWPPTTPRSMRAARSP